MAMAFFRACALAFGADPQRITIGGESAGAGSTTNHLVMPRSFPHYRAAVLESGSFATWSAHPMAEAERVFTAMLQNTSCETVACLEALPAASLTQAAVNIHLSVPFKLPFICPWAPAIDGVELSAHPWILLKSSKVSPDAAILHGTNRDEGWVFSGGLSPEITRDQTLAWWGSAFGPANVPELASLYLNQWYPTQSGFSASW
jgi:acetylcholinesterase